MFSSQESKSFGCSFNTAVGPHPDPDDCWLATVLSCCGCKAGVQQVGSARQLDSVRLSDVSPDSARTRLDMRFVRSKAVAGQLPCLADSASTQIAERCTGRSKMSLGEFMQWWTDPRIKHKLASAHRTALPLVKACGAGKSSKVRILDATGGWGVDAATLVAAGATVDIIERNPIMAQLLADILEQAHSSSELLGLLRGEVGGLWGGDASAVLDAATATRPLPEHVQHLWPPAAGEDSPVSPAPPSTAAPRAPAQPGPWDVVYIDAMFPPRGKASAAVKLPAQWLHAVAAQEAIQALRPTHPLHEGLLEALKGGRISDMGGVLSRAMGALVESEGVNLDDDTPPADALAAPLVRAALNSPVRRVVVKRPGRAAPIDVRGGEEGGASAAPTFAVDGKAVRFDVYQRPWLQHGRE